MTVSDRTLVIKILPETEGESTCVRMKTLFMDGLGLKNSQFNIEKTQGKGDTNMTRSYSRVLITTLKDNDAVKMVMKSKSKLKNNEQFKKAYIDINQPFMERKLENSLRTIINSVTKDKLLIKGGRVVTKPTIASKGKVVEL